MDLFYPLGPGSKWEDNELRYSLRSVQRYMPHTNVVIAGYLPPWITGVGHVPAGDRWSSGVRNTLHKLELAVNSGLLSERFTVLNDDFLLLRDFDADAPTTVWGTMQQRVTDGPRGADPYYDVLVSGMKLLRAQGIEEPLNYETHVPLVMECTKVRTMLQRFGSASTRTVYPWRSVYGNLFHVPAVLGTDVKQRREFHLPPATQGLLSMDDDVAMDASFQQWCALRWMTPSRYEQG